MDAPTAGPAETADQPAKSKATKVEFDPPAGFKLPEGTKSSNEFDMLCTLRAKDDGKLCLVKLGDTPMPGYDEKGEDATEREPQSRPDYRDYSSGIMAGMAQPQGG